MVPVIVGDSFESYLERKRELELQKQRDEQERKKQQEIERQLEKQRQIEQQKEEERKKLQEQREVNIFSNSHGSGDHVFISNKTSLSHIHAKKSIRNFILMRYA